MTVQSECDSPDGCDKPLKVKLEKLDKFDVEQMLPDDLDDLYKTMPLTEETTCGIGFIKGKFLQKFANKKSYVFLYGIIGCIFSATFAYFNGTITTIEKRFKIPSKNTGIISVGNDVSQLFLSAVLSYYAGKGHRPRWMACGLLSVVIFCLINVSPHFLYGSGNDALSLTIEYGGKIDVNASTEIMEKEKSKTLCRLDAKDSVQCEVQEGNFIPQALFFIAQLVAGIGQPLFYTIGIAYMDDNTKKSKSPALLSFSYFCRMSGPALGYTIASICLKMYISPTLTPVIQTLDPRWLGAWWLGWLILSAAMFVSALAIVLFPKTLPRAAVRRAIQQVKMKRENVEPPPPTEKASVKDMMQTFKRLMCNQTLMYNNLAGIFYFFGFIPYWQFTAKYIEIQYRQSASSSNLYTGTTALACSAIGILLSGMIISKYKPCARYMAAWNVIVGAISVIGMITYTQLGCRDIETSVIVNHPSSSISTPTCNSNCNCDYVKYSPVCGADGNTYISGCHAGCTERINENNKTIYTQCSCITSSNLTDHLSISFASFDRLINGTNNDVSFQQPDKHNVGGWAKPGPCPVDCYNKFLAFIAVVCFIKFMASTGRATNVLVSVRCVAEKDKTVSIGFCIMIMCLFAFIPSPIYFGSIIDKACLVWGKTCSSKGNCWLYDTEKLRWDMNIMSAAFISVGVFFDCVVWYKVKNLKIFDDDELSETQQKQDEKSNENVNGKENLEKSDKNFILK